MQRHTTATAALEPAATSALARSAVLVYGVVSYVLGVSGLGWLILVTLGLVPFTGGPLAIASPALAIAFNLLLVALFGVQHAIMARPWFKQRWTRVIPPAAERSTFTLLAGLLMGGMMAFWQPLPGLVWAVETPALAVGLRVLCALGWAYMLTATFAIDHFELFGLKQVFRHFENDHTPRPAFTMRWMYAFDRHPLMSGVLVALWSTPVMRLDHLVLALGLTAYIGLGVAVEERDLVRLHGDGYREYRRRVRTIVPLLGNRG